MGNHLRYWVCLVITVSLCCPLFGSLVFAQKNRPKNVQVALRAKWSGTPLLLEAGELLSKEGRNIFFDFTESWLEAKDGESDAHTAKDCLKKIVNHGKSLLSEPLASVFEFSLTLRSASPRLELYRQLAKDSLASFPLSDNESPDLIDGVISEPNASKKANIGEPTLFGNNPKSHGGKCCWVDTGSSLFFDVEEFLVWLSSSREIAANAFQQPEIFEFDHVHMDSTVGSPVAVLYGALGTDCFRKFHLSLVDASRQGRVTYVVRPVMVAGCESNSNPCGAVGTKDPVNLGGYGVELALKNMEYKSMDDSAIKKGVTLEDPHTEDLSQEVRGFIFSRILERKPELTSEIMSFRDYLLSSTVSDTLNVWELRDLGHQTAQRIVHASDPLQAMQEINHNFPSVVSSLSRMKLNESIKDEIVLNQRMIPPGKSLMALNSALVNIDDIDLYMLIDMVHQELSLADQYSKLKIPPSDVRKLLSTMPPSEPSTFRVDFRSTHVHYLNNLEDDAKYKRWRSNLNEILMPVFPGQLRHIRKNLYHAVYIIDPASICGLEAIDTILMLHENNIPMRFGVVLYSGDVIKSIESNDGDTPLAYTEDNNQSVQDVSSLIIRLFIYIEKNHGTPTAFQFLKNVNKLSIESAEDDMPEMHHVEAAFVDTILPQEKSRPQDTLLKLQKEQTYSELSMESSMFVFKMGLAKQECCLLMNGLVYESTEEETLLNAMNDELPRIQEQVYYGQINAHTDVLDKFLSESGIRRYNPQIIGNGKVKPKIISLSTSVLKGEDSVLNEIGYLHAPETIDDVKPVTHLLVVNISSKKGVKLLHEGLRYLMGGSELARVGVLFNVNQSARLRSLLFMKVFEITASSYSHKKGVLKFLDELCSFIEHDSVLESSEVTDKDQAFLDKVKELADANGIPSKYYESDLSGFTLGKLQEHFKKEARFISRELGMGSDVNAVVTNGRVIPVSANVAFLSHDLSLLEYLEFNQRTKHLFEIIEEIEWTGLDPDIVTSKFISDTVMSVSSSIAQRERSSESARFELLGAEFSAVVLENENSSIHIDAVIDPLSSSGQKLSSLLRLLSIHARPSMRLVLNPVSSLADLPLKNFYRYVVPTVDDFSATDYSVYGPKAFFANMPLSKTLTMNLDVPEPWLVEPVVAVHDLDNILLENLADTRTLSAVFELEALVLTGHCSEKDNEPPRGLQLILGTKNSPHLVDTIVMANLGYFQMKAFPGVWYLQLARGRSSELYDMKHVDGSEEGSLSRRITIDDLRGKLVHLEVEKKKGLEHEKLLAASRDDNSLENTKGGENSWNSNILKWASGFIGGSDQSKKNSNLKEHSKDGRRQGKTINIFSVASGHLYERFLKIMILSVLKNTERPVKFWFIKNYLSPQFKAVIPYMAQDYGFEYELITYKWPTWLHKQTEKQRIIWAYKILFLDVIFPLALEKVIFVDADQIVRTDMGDLYDMDLRGRPLAYTPFCDNNKEMDGYRFWKQGFWKEHLRGRPYHISALYVVDLAKFRETAAGDNLRVFYETLSKDPNSLSNLDQDLPNYAQHTVPIFSLPQEWLWCESWCGNTTKSKAKTIDLCNNPMTKEPKLQGARRIVSEWPDLDYEARQFTAKILGETLEPEQKEPPSQDSASVETSSEDQEWKAEL